MRKTVILLLAFALTVFADEKETIQRAFSGARTIEVDNVDGSIHVAGYNGGETQMTIHKTIHAASAAKVEEAKRDVKLDVSEKDGTLRLYVDGPFRCNCREGERGSRHQWSDPGYEVTFDFTLQIPSAANVWLRTVNRGDIRVENTTGTFDVENINGGLELSEVSGSGRAYALNHPVKVLFSRNPGADSYFGSLNGDVDVAFRPDLSADLRMKTFNGQAYTDFPVTALPGAARAPERRDGKFVYRSDGFFGVRAGRGGPEIKFDAFNGNIRITERK